jgi:hypothetical protein
MDSSIIIYQLPLPSSLLRCHLFLFKKMVVFVVVVVVMVVVVVVPRVMAMVKAILLLLLPWYVDILHLGVFYMV